MLISRVEAWWQSVGDRSVTGLRVLVCFREHRETVRVEDHDEGEE